MNRFRLLLFAAAASLACLVPAAAMAAVSPNPSVQPVTAKCAPITADAMPMLLVPAAEGQCDAALEAATGLCLRPADTSAGEVPTVIAVFDGSDCQLPSRPG